MMVNDSFSAYSVTVDRSYPNRPPCYTTLLASGSFLDCFFRNLAVPGDEAAAFCIRRPQALCKESVNRFRISKIVYPATSLP